MFLKKQLWVPLSLFVEEPHVQKLQKETRAVSIRTPTQVSQKQVPPPRAKFINLVQLDQKFFDFKMRRVRL